MNCHSFRILAATAVAAALAASSHASTQTVTYNDFGDLSNIQLNGSAATINSSGPIVSGGQPVLRLTNDYFQGGSAFLKDAIPLMDSGGFQASFSTEFQFQIQTEPNTFGDGDGPGADGLCFVVQTVANTAGGVGGDLGYAGINNSLGIEFDTYDNGGGFNDPDGNHVGIDLNGNIASVATQPIAKRMNDGDLWNSWVDYDGSTHNLEVRLDTSTVRPTAATLAYNVDLTSILGQPNAFVGFTSGTGSGYGLHDIRNWIFTNTYQPITSPVPEPSSVALLLAGIPAVAAFRRRKS